MGSYIGITELDLKDIDGDGLLDFQLASGIYPSGRWIGWSQTTNSWVVKE